MPPYFPLVIANEFITRSIRSNNYLTHMQIQKLVYLAHGWFLGQTGKPLLMDQYEAWQFGPVNRKLYNALSKFGSKRVDALIRWGDDTPFPSDDDGEAVEPISGDATQVIDLVWEIYGRFPAFKLSALTHQDGTPWAITFKNGRNTPIPDDLIRNHFQSLAA